MSDVGRLAAFWDDGLEEAWSIKARLAAAEARREKHRGALAIGAGREVDRLGTFLGMPRRDDLGAILRAHPRKTDAELFPGSAPDPTAAHHAALLAGPVSHHYDVGDHSVHVHESGQAHVEDAGGVVVGHFPSEEGALRHAQRHARRAA